MSLNEMIMWCLFIEQIIVCYSKHSYVSEKGPACFTSWLKWMDSVCDLALAGSVTQSCDLPGCACASWRLVLARFYYTGWHLNRCWRGPDMVGWDFHRQCAERTAMGEVCCFTHAWLDTLTHSLTHTHKLLCASFTISLICVRVCVCVCVWDGLKVYALGQRYVCVLFSAVDIFYYFEIT